MSEDMHRVGEILIVGGGTAGWMTAAYLREHTPCRITLVESPDVETIGVGEATIPALIDFLNSLKLNEDQFMRRCHATYKLAIQFRNWIHPQHAYWHPFGLCGGTIDGIDLFHFWLKSRRAGRTNGPYSSYSLQTLLAEQGKSHRPIGGESVVINYAYHLDAAAFAHYLQEVAVGKGVQHLRENIRHVGLDSTGKIDHLKTDTGRMLTADLFIDCTGFRGLLIEQALGDPHIDWSHQLLCDRAAVLRLPRSEQMRPYTLATGVRAGWIWEIPLSQRVGCGYVFSSHHTSDEDATRELLQYAGQDERRAADVRFLKMRIGRRQQFWKQNCVSVGLASGFIEPLESTGIFLIQRALELLIEWFPDQTFNPILLRHYNGAMARVYDEIRDFVLLHYLLTQRDDHPFWPDSRHVPLPDSLRERMEWYDSTALIIEDGESPTFRETSFYHIYSGGERLPRRYLPRADLSNFDSICQLLQQIQSGNQRLAASLPSHAALVQWLHGGM